jgi:hypothetical protein
MSDAIQASVQREGSLGCVLQLLVTEPGLAGKEGTLKVEQLAHVKRSSPVHARNTLAEKRFTLAHGLNRIPIGDVVEELYTYSGSKLDLKLTAHVEIDDGLIFDTKLQVDLGPACRLPPRSAVPKECASVHSPRDRFDFIANLRAIPAKARLMVLWLIAIGLPVILFNAALGVRDQFVPESQIWFYDHSDSDGEGESPLMKALMGSGAAGVAIWLAIRRQLQKYMRFEAKLPSGKLHRELRVPARELIEGEARVALQHAVARVVAYNREHGQYTQQEKQGKSTRTVTKSFTENGRGVVLYEQALAHVPANAPLRDYLEGEVNFAPLFDALYPPCRVGSTHGLSLQFEAQLLHPEFVDHDVELPVDDSRLPRSAFYREETAG